jgi:hypothetical protein
MRKATASEYQTLNFDNSELLYCHACDNGSNEWYIADMLKNDYEEIVTPCCFSYAPDSLSSYQRNLEENVRTGYDRI